MNREPPRLPLLLPVVAVAYALTGWLALRLAIPPGYASPIYPPAGIALACALVYGHRVLPAIALGSFAINALVGDGARSIAVALAIAFGATLQAAAGRALVVRTVSTPLILSEPRDIARFFVFGAALSCVVSASLGTAALVLGGVMPVAAAPTTWGTWWIGDTLGVLIGAPVVLSFIGRPHDDWSHRRSTVAVSLVLVTALMAMATSQVARWDEQRTRVIFERDATRSAEAVAAQLGDPLRALEAMRSVFLAAGTPSREGFRLASATWLAQPMHLRAIGYAERVDRSAIPRFEQAVRAESGLAGYRVFDRTDAEAARGAAADRDVVAIRYIEPQRSNAAALGVNPLSIAPARPAIQATRRTGRAAASGGFRLTQETGDQTGVVIYQAVYDGQPGDELLREAALRGILFVTLRMEDALASVMESQPQYLRWCLVDTDPAAARKRLAGAPGCERDVVAADAFEHRRSLPYAGRHWQLRLAADAAAVPEPRHWNAWLFSLVGLLATAMLGALLLSVTGRTRRIQVAVAERTVDLQREVAERMRTEVALRESEQRFRNILDHVPIGAIYTDLAGRIKESNPKLREMVGYGADELATMSWADLTHPEDRAEDIELAKRLVRAEVPTVRRHKRLIARDGRVVWVQASLSVLRDPHGRPMRLVGVVEDITEHLKLQEAERARERAEAANRAKSDFLSRMSHELRTPLNAMLGFAQLLELDRKRALEPHQLEWTSQIQQAGWHLLHMINDTLDLSRIESGTVKLQIEPVRLADTVAATRVLVEQAAQARGVTIELALDPRAPAVLADATRVKQVLTNLLSNAVKYNVAGGRVQVRSRLAGADAVEVEVRDTGLGMTTTQMADLFTPFNRLGREAYGEGTGIGLVISRRLAELMGGSLDAESVAGAGSTFRLRLPRAPDAVRVADERAGDDVAPDYRQRTVHYVEDNETNAEVMRGILAQRPQVRLEVSTSGLDGLAAIRRRTPSLVLLDMHLPDIDGLELLRHLKRDPTTAEIPVVVVSADATAARIDEALRLGATRYVTKPVNVAEMLSTLDELLEQQDTRFG